MRPATQVRKGITAQTEWDAARRVQRTVVRQDARGELGVVVRPRATVKARPAAYAVFRRVGRGYEYVGEHPALRAAVKALAAL